MKEIIIYLALVIVFFLMFTGGLVYILQTYGHVLSEALLSGVTEVSKAITAGQLAH